MEKFIWKTKLLKTFSIHSARSIIGVAPPLPAAPVHVAALLLRGVHLLAAVLELPLVEQFLYLDR